MDKPDFFSLSSPKRRRAQVRRRSGYMGRASVNLIEYLRLNWVERHGTRICDP